MSASNTLRSRADRRWFFAIVTVWLIGCIAGLIAISVVVGQAWDGESIGKLNNYIERHRAVRLERGVDASRGWYRGWAQAYVLKVVVPATIGLVSVAAAVLLPRVRRRVRRFFFHLSSPLNLGVLRVAVFLCLLNMLSSEPILEYSQWSADEYDWPLVAAQTLRYLPVSLEISQALLPVAIGFCLLACVGFFTRVSCLATVVLAVYLLAIPQASGKVNHLHHLVLLAGVLGLSRCGDALSIDSFLNAVRRADRGSVTPPGRMVRYGLPIRISMLLLALLYFFPGYWKMANGGLEWIFSDNLRNTMLQKWFELEHYRPLLPFHDIPVMPQLGAFTAVTFEFFFPLALFWRYTRGGFATLGLMFHNLTGLMLNIWFSTLQAMYVMFVDWQRVFAWLGRRLLGRRLAILYDGQCKLCRRTIAVLSAMDALSLLDPVVATDRDAIDRLGVDGLDDEALMTDMHSISWSAGGEPRIARGYEAYQAIAKRLPVFWWLVPVMALAPVAKIGSSIYRRIADSRLCKVSYAAGCNTPVAPTRWSPVPIVVLGGSILFAQYALGIGRCIHSWPVACYPLFDTPRLEQLTWPEFVVVSDDGVETILDDDPLRYYYGSARYVAVLRRTIDAAEKDQTQLIGLVSELLKPWRESGELPSAKLQSLQINKLTYRLTGPRRPEYPESREALTRIEWADLAEASENEVPENKSPETESPSGSPDASETNPKN